MEWGVPGSGVGVVRADGLPGAGRWMLPVRKIVDGVWPVAMKRRMIWDA